MTKIDLDIYKLICHGDSFIPVLCNKVRWDPLKCGWLLFASLLVGCYLLFGEWNFATFNFSSELNCHEIQLEGRLLFGLWLVGVDW